jgi:tetratricopeptide (TPR) repeat protein
MDFRSLTRRAHLLPLFLLGTGCGDASGKAAQGSGASGSGAPGSTSALLAYEAGNQFQTRGQVEKALAEYRRATELDPTMAEAQFALGRALMQSSSKTVGSKARDHDELGQAVAAFERALELQPNNDELWFWKGRAFGLMNEPERSRECQAKALEINPENQAAQKALGMLQKDAGEIEAARASFERVVARHPRDAGAHAQLGQTLELLGDIPAARAAYAKAVESDPLQVEVYGRLTQVCAKLGDAEGEARARADLERWQALRDKLDRRQRALNQAPSDAAALRRLGEVYFEIGRLSQALELFLRAVLANPKDEVAHLDCGTVLLLMKDYKNAEKHLKESEFLAPDLIDPKLELVRLYAGAERSAELAAAIAATEALAVDDGVSLFALGEVCREIGRAEEATRLLARARELGVTEAPSATEETGDG